MVNYRKTLSDLKDYQKGLGLENNPPTERVTVIPGTQNPGRPLGADLPVYPKEECTTDEEGMGKVLFNLRSMFGFVPPSKKL